MNIAPSATASMRKWISTSPFLRFFQESIAASQPPVTRPRRKKPRASQGRPGAKCSAVRPAMPLVPHTAASLASVRHSWSSGCGSALISGHSISRQSQSFSAVTQVSRSTTIAPPSRRTE
jgi:hypothetical protein